MTFPVDSVKSREIQRLFREHGPDCDRFTDWWRCQEQPWSGLAEILVNAR